jgi:hypothetical protein
MLTTMPAGVPLLSPGSHTTAIEGACLMEYVSVLAGERFSDRPRCAQPVLAAIARGIDAVISDDRRPALAALAPDIIGTVSADPMVDTVLCGLVAATALHTDMTDHMAQATLREAQHRADVARWSRLRGRWQVLTRRRYRVRAVHAVARMVPTVARGGDDRLEALLSEAIGVCRRHMPVPRVRAACPA